MKATRQRVHKRPAGSRQSRNPGMEDHIVAKKNSKRDGQSRKLPPGMVQRGRVYYASFRRNGRLVRKRLAPDFRVACDLLDEMKARAARADFGLIDNDVSLDTLRDQWLGFSSQGLRASSIARYQQNLANVWRGVAARRVSQLGVQSVTSYRANRLAAGAAKQTVNMEVGTLSIMLNWGVKHRLIGSNPLAAVESLPVDDHDKRKVRRSLGIEEVEALFEYSPPRLRAVWVVFMTTGIRRGELFNMRFRDVDYERKTVMVRSHTAKNHKAREIPLSEEVLDITRALELEAPNRKPVSGKNGKLARQQRARFTRDHVFVTSANTPLSDHLRNQFYSICHKAGIEGAYPGGSVDIHALRVSFITISLDHGASAKAIQAIVGHSSLAMTTDVYANEGDRPVEAGSDRRATLRYGGEARPRPDDRKRSQGARKLFGRGVWDWKISGLVTYPAEHLLRQRLPGFPAERLSPLRGVDALKTHFDLGLVHQQRERVAVSDADHLAGQRWGCDDRGGDGQH
jgi:integrase